MNSMPLRHRLTSAGIFLLAWLLAGLAPAQAAVTITFWSHDSGKYFPHAFFTLRGTLDGDGTPVDATYGFTAVATSPAILFGSVPGRIDETRLPYIMTSDAQFSTAISDEQYRQVMALAQSWGERGNSQGNLNRRNCVHFVAEAARRSGLAVVEEPRLMKKPRSFLQSVGEANASRVLTLRLTASEYFGPYPDQLVTGGNGAPNSVLDRPIDRSALPRDAASPAQGS